MGQRGDVHYSDVEKVGPSVPAVSTVDAKTYLVVEHDDHDTLIDECVTAATERVETLTRLQLITATRTLTLDRFPDDWIRVPRPPLQSVTHVKYIDGTGVQQTWSSALYVVDVNSKPGRICPIPNEPWPTIEAGRREAVEVEYKCGFGDAATDVESWLLIELKRIAQGLYKSRGDAEKSVAFLIRDAEERLLANKVHGV
jgi:uncharacterized phiE125 gp8 family phage protein